MNNIYSKKHLFLFLTFISAATFFPHRNLHSQSTAAPAIILSSYSVSGNALTDDDITLHLVFSNTSRSYNVYNALFTYIIQGDTFFPSSGKSNQFIIPIIQPNASVEYDLKLSVRNALPNEQLQLDFDVAFSDERGNTNLGKFFINRFFRSSDVIHLMGIKVIEAEKLSDNYWNSSVRIAVINQSNFLAQNVVMLLEGVNNSYSTSIPFNDINPGIHSIRYFNLNFTSNNIPEFTVKFTFNDVDEAKYVSSPQRFFVYLDHVVYSDESPNKENRTVFFIRTALFIALTTALIIGTVILLLKLSRKKGV